MMEVIISCDMHYISHFYIKIVKFGLKRGGWRWGVAQRQAVKGGRKGSAYLQGWLQANFTLLLIKTQYFSQLSIQLV